MRSLTEYRETLERVRGGTVPVDLALEIVDAWERDAERSAGEYTITRAVELSGKSRGWFRRRIDDWARQGLARQLSDGTWLVKDAAVPIRRRLPSGGVDPSLSDEDIYAQLVS